MEEAVVAAARVLGLRAERGAAGGFGSWWRQTASQTSE